MITYDSEFPVYGDITSIDQVERIQEYVDNKILDSLSWIAGSLDLIIRGHTLAIGTIIEQVGKSIKQEQRRIQRTIDKHEKTAELAVYSGIVYEEPGQPPSGDDLDRDAPPIDEPYPWEPPTQPPVEPPAQPPTQPPVTCVPGGLVPCPPQPPPTGDNGNGTGNGNDTGNDTGNDGENGNGNNNNNNNFVDCNYSSNSVAANTRPNDGAIIRNNTIIYGGQMDICSTLNKFGDNAKGTLNDTFGNSQTVYHIPGTFFPFPSDGEKWNWYSDIKEKAVRVHNYNASKITPYASTPFEELGESLARATKKGANGDPEPYNPVFWPNWLKTDSVPKVPYSQFDQMANISNSSPDIRA